MPALLEILYADRHVLAVAKPPRLLTASDHSGDETLLERARAYHFARQAEGKKGYLVPVHFLDRPVSGVVLFALSSKAAARLSQAFREGRIQKTYRAVIEGSPGNSTAELEDVLLKDEATNITRSVAKGTPGGKLSRLSLRPLVSINRLTLLDIRPKTGRSHQIRVQLASRGWPIYGDVKYGASQSFHGQIALHARAMEFEHPVSKELMTIEAQIPSNWREFWPGDLDV